ncbi:hypothetical protein DSECCO2_560480 [anaerobic digester metagenome]
MHMVVGNRNFCRHACFLEYFLKTFFKIIYTIETNSIRVLRKGYILQSHIYFKESHIYFLEVLVSILLPKS